MRLRNTWQGILDSGGHCMLDSLCMIGAHIRRIRVARGLTQRQVAERAKVAKNYITMLEIGYRKNCSLPVLKRIAKALGVPAGKLLE